MGKELHKKFDELDKLISYNEGSVRMAVAFNLNASIETLEKLGKDRNPYVRMAVALSPRVPYKTLLKLAGDTEPCVMQAVFKNINGWYDAIEKIYRTYRKNDDLAYSTIVGRHIDGVLPILEQARNNEI